MKLLEILADVDIEGQLEEGIKNIPREEIDIRNILNYVYVFMGMIAVVVIIYNGLMYVMSTGDPSRTKKATQGLIFAAVGLAIVLLATIITNYLFSVLGGS